MHDSLLFLFGLTVGILIVAALVGLLVAIAIVWTIRALERSSRPKKVA